MPNSTKKNKLRKFSGTDGSLVKKVFPAQVRTFVSTLTGNKDPITEKDFTDEELKQAKDAVIKSRDRQTGKRFIASGTPGKKDYKLDQYYDPTIDYKDYGKGKDETRQDFNVGSDAAMRNTLGRFKYEKTPEGRLVATDTYDFKDDLAKQYPKIPRTKDYEGLNTVEKIGKLAVDTLKPSAGGIKSLPSRVGNAFIGKDGRPVKIDLGEAPFKKGGKVNKPKQSSASKRGDGIAQRGKTRGRVV
jgi:hypothetical protein